MPKHVPLALDYLRTHTLAQLESEHGVCSRPNSRLDKVSLNYDQTKIRPGNLLAEQCRGMVIRPRDWIGLSTPPGWTLNNTKDAPWRGWDVGECELLAWPMSRFYNDGDPAAASVDWAKARMLEKLDGTMCVLYWDPLHAQWHVGTRSVPEADLPVKAGHLVIGDMTFAGLFWRSWERTIASTTGPHPPIFECISGLCKRTTYAFELTGPHNKVVVDYPDERVTLLAARDLDTGHELDPRGLDHPFGTWVPIAREWDLMDPHALRTHIRTHPGNVCEGAVVTSWGPGPEPTRRKFKNDRWLMAARFKDTIDSSRRGALRMIVDGTWTPGTEEIGREVALQFARLARGLAAYLAKVDANFADWSARAIAAPGENMRKAFALLVQSCPPAERSPAYFQLWDGKAGSAADWLATLCRSGRLSDGTLDDIIQNIDMLANDGVSEVF